MPTRFALLLRRIPAFDQRFAIPALLHLLALAVHAYSFSDTTFGGALQLPMPAGTRCRS
jgi:hypothetical protein